MNQWSVNKALEVQLQLARFWQTDDGINWALLGDDVPEGFRKSRLISTVRTLASGDTYFLSQEILELLFQGMDTFPEDVTLENVGVPSTTGFLYIEPGPVGQPLTHVCDEHHHMLGGISWDNTGFDSEDKQPVCSIVLYSDMHMAGGQFRPVSEMGWYHKMPWTQVEGWEETDSAGSEFKSIQCLIASFFAFVKQKIATVHTEQPSRALRRRAEASSKENPLIRVVLLRANKSKSGNRKGEPVNWSCRWIVKPHWTNQFYPSTKSNKPKYIAAYVKGPDDKPLKRKPIDIFAVVR